MNKTVREWVRTREITGKPLFSFSDLKVAFPSSADQLLLNNRSRLKRDRILYSPYKSFYVVLPPQYVLIGSVPASYYMEELMGRLGKKYYFGLLTAAAMWGSAHQRPMVDCVMTEPPRLSSAADKRNVRWVYRPSLPVQHACVKNGEYGVVRYSSAELTAVELVQYESHAGGMSRVATVIEELLEATDFAHAADGVFRVCKDTAIQRLGYIVEKEIGDERQGEVIYHEWVRCCPTPHFIPLGVRSDGRVTHRDERWKIDVNMVIERDEI